MTQLDASVGDILQITNAHNEVIGTLIIREVKAGRVKVSYDPNAAEMKRVEKRKRTSKLLVLDKRKKLFDTR